MAEATDSRALSKIKRWQSLRSDRAPWDEFWREVARYAMPDQYDLGTRHKGRDASRDRYDDLFDSTAIHAAMTLARGQFSQITPPGQRWFKFAPSPIGQTDDEVDSWYQRCTEITAHYLANSNFYGEIFKNYIQRGVFGTGALFVDEGDGGEPLYFRTFPIGTYCIDENHQGRVDTVYRDFELSARAAVLQFGAAAPPEVKEDAMSKDARKQDRKYEFLHVVEPNRSFSESKPMGGKNFPFSSCYICVKTKTVVKEGGYRSNPYIVSRYIPKANSPWGWTPSYIALPEARQANFLEMNLDALAEVAAFPRVLVPESLEGEVNLSAGGITYYNSLLPNSEPKEWATQGSYQHGEIRAEAKREAIKKAFHVDLFNLFSEMDVKNVTARAIAEQANERISQFFPVFTMMTTELFNPLLRRVFAILAERGAYPAAPANAGVQTEAGVLIPDPDVLYTGRVGMMVKRMDNASFIAVQETLFPLFQARPDLMDNYDLDAIAREYSRNEGLPDRWLLPEEVRDRMRQMRAQQQAAMAQMEMNAQAADAVGKLKGMTPDEAQGLAALAG